MALRRQFELNYLAARENVGRVLAERMFVKANRAGNTDLPDPAPPPAR